MKKVNVALVRFLQFVVLVLFTFIVMLYFGALVLLPYAGAATDCPLTPVADTDADVDAGTCSAAGDPSCGSISSIVPPRASS